MPDETMEIDTLDASTSFESIQNDLMAISPNLSNNEVRVGSSTDRPPLTNRHTGD